MNNETTEIRQMKRFMVAATIIAIFAFACSIVKNVVNERWAKSRDTVACVPADTDQAFPMVYHQTALNPVQNDAMMKSFVYEYVKLTQDEQIVDYHATTDTGKRYVEANLRDNLKKAIEMSLDNERALNIDKYAKSSEVYNRLIKGNWGWIFLVDDILLFNGPQAASGAPHSDAGFGYTYAVIRGQFQVTYDTVKKELPPELWGYKEIHLLISQGVPTMDTKNNYVNKYGLYVVWSNTYDIDANRKDIYQMRNSDHYLKQE